jgi:transposase
LLNALAKADRSHSAIKKARTHLQALFDLAVDDRILDTSPARRIDQLRWQRLNPFEKLAWMLLDHLEGILNHCRTIPFGVVEAVNGNIKSLLRRGRGYKNLRYLLLKAQRMAAIKTEFVVSGKPRKMAIPPNSCSEPNSP